MQLGEEVSLSKTSDEITKATNKGWVLGGDRFKEQIEKQTGRRTEPSARGDDRKAKIYLRFDRNHQKRKKIENN